MRLGLREGGVVAAGTADQGPSGAAAAGRQQVAAGAAVEVGRARKAADQAIVTGAAIDPVSAGAGLDQVVLGTAVDHVIAIAAVDPHEVDGAEAAFDPSRSLPGPRSAISQRAGPSDRAADLVGVAGRMYAAFAGREASRRGDAEAPARFVVGDGEVVGASAADELQAGAAFGEGSRRT